MPEHEESERIGDVYLLNRMESIKGELMLAINGMRDRHHDAVNVLTSEYAKLAIAQAGVAAQVQEVRTDLAAFVAQSKEDRVALHAQVSDLMTWRTKVMGIMVGAVVAAGLGGGGLAGIIVHTLSSGR